MNRIDIAALTLRQSELLVGSPTNSNVLSGVFDTISNVPSGFADTYMVEHPRIRIIARHFKGDSLLTTFINSSRESSLYYLLFL